MSEKTMTTKSTGSGRVMMLAAALLWGMAGICVRSIDWGPLSQVAARSLLSLIVVLIFKRSLKVKLTRQNILGALAMTATGMLYVTAITMTGAGTAIVLQYIAPILVFLYSVLFKHQKASLPQVLITVMVFIGVLLSFIDQMDMTHLVGNLLAVLSGITFAAQIVIMNGEDNDSEDCLIISCVISLVVALPFMFTDKNLVWDQKNILWILILGIFQYGLANVIFGKGIKKVDGVEGSLILTIEPIFNPIPVAIFLGEMMGTKAIIGAVIVILGVTAYGLLPWMEEKLRTRKVDSAL